MKLRKETPLETVWREAFYPLLAWLGVELGMGGCVGWQQSDSATCMSGDYLVVATFFVNNVHFIVLTPSSSHSTTSSRLSIWRLTPGHTEGVSEDIFCWTLPQRHWKYT